MSQAITFERFTLKRDERRLYADGVVLPVSSPGFRLLLALVDKAGALLTKDELMKSVWGASSVSENALHVQIAALRKLIGNHLIITQSGIGYRFVGLADETRASPVRRANAGLRDLVGREILLRDMAKALDCDRFVTLTGPGGVGKTSLARAFLASAKERYQDGAWFVELAALRDQAGLAETIKSTLRIEGGFESDALDEIVARLHPQRVLLVLDNCEHLLPAVSRLAEALFAGAPELCMIATSRQPLFCIGEQVLAVPPLPVPSANTRHTVQARRSGAYRLFVDKILSLDPAFAIADEQVAIAARICRRLDGLPLALEIVASWASVLGLEALEEKLDAHPISWPHASAAAPLRHHDLRTALDWSYELLTQAERIVLRRVSVFAEGFSLEAAEHVVACGLLPGDLIFTHLVNLVRKSLLTKTQGRHRPTYRLLETTRAYAQEKLIEAGEELQLRGRHAAYLRVVMSRAEQDWATSDSRAWLDKYANLLADLRAAIDWTIGKGHDLGGGIALAAASWPLWRELSLRIEGARLLGAAAGAVQPDTAISVQAGLLHGLGMLHCDYQFDVARQAYEESEKLYVQIGDPSRLAAVRLCLAGSFFLLGDVDRAADLAAKARALLPRGGGARRWDATAFDLDLMLHLHYGRFTDARHAGRQALIIWDALGADRAALTTRSNMVEIALCNNDLAEALREGRIVADRLRDTPHVGTLAFVLTNVTAALVRLGDFAASMETAQEAVQLMPGCRPMFALMDHLALGLAMRGETEDAATLMGFADHAHAVHGWPRQHVEQLAAGALGALLEQSMPCANIARLASQGAMLPEAAAWSIAFRMTGRNSAEARPDSARTSAVSSEYAAVAAFG